MKKLDIDSYYALIKPLLLGLSGEDIRKILKKFFRDGSFDLYIKIKDKKVKYSLKELHEITEEDRKNIYEYAIKRSKEIVDNALKGHTDED